MNKNILSNTENIVVKSKIIERQKRALKTILTKQLKDKDEPQYKYIQEYLRALNELSTNFQNKNYSEFMKIYTLLEKHGKISDAEKLVKKIYQHTNSMDYYENLDSNFERENTKLFWKDQWQIPFTVKKDRNIYILELKNFTEKERTSFSPQYFIDMVLKQYIGNEIEFKNKLFSNHFLIELEWIKLKKAKQNIPNNSMNTILELDDVRMFNYIGASGLTCPPLETKKEILTKITKKYTDPPVNLNVIYKINRIMDYIINYNTKIDSTYKIENNEYASRQTTIQKNNDLIELLTSVNQKY